MVSQRVENIQRFLGDSNTPIPVMPIDSNSLKKLMFKIPVGYDFMLATYAG